MTQQNSVLGERPLLTILGSPAIGALLIALAMFEAISMAWFGVLAVLWIPAFLYFMAGKLR